MGAEEFGGEEEGAEEVGGRIRRRRRMGSSSISIHHGWCQNFRKCVHSGIDSSMVLLQHRSVAVEQVLAEQLRFRIPRLLDHEPHDGMCIAELRSNRMVEDSPDASNPIANPVYEDRGNISLRFLPVSFNQAVGATTPFFTAVFAYFLTLRREAWLVYGALIPVVTGVMIASGGEPRFHLYDFAMCIMATAARALKSVVQGILLSSEGEKLNSMNLLLYMAPIAVVVLVPATLLLEPNVAGITVALARKDVLMLLLLFVNSTMAYFVNLTNVLVTKHTSALTLQMRRAPWLWLFPFCSSGIPSPSLAWWAMVSLSLGFFFTVKQNGGASDLLVGCIVSSETSFFLSILFVAAAPDACRVAAVAA